MVAGQTRVPRPQPVEVFHNIMYDEPPVLTGGPAVSALDRVINRRSPNSRDDRYQTAAAFAQELRSVAAPRRHATGRAAARRHASHRPAVSAPAARPGNGLPRLQPRRRHHQFARRRCSRSSSDRASSPARFGERHARPEGARHRGRRRRRGYRHAASARAISCA